MKRIETEQSKRHHKFPVKSGLLYNSNDTSTEISSNIKVSEIFQTDDKPNTIKQIYKNLVNYYLIIQICTMKLKKRKLLFLLIVMILFESMDHLARTYNVNDGADGSLNDNNILLDLITRCSTDIGTEFYEDSLIELNKFIYQLYYKSVDS